MASGDVGAKYQRIADDLRQEIVGGQLVEGDEVPGENALMERYGVARMTARQALQLLRDEGLLDVRRGKGTFVRYSSSEDPRHAPAMGPKTEGVYEEIRRRVVEGDYAPGDKLPSERALSEQLDIGRTALRQALSRLVTEGVIERHNRSAYRVPRSLVEGSVPVPDALLEELRDRHGMTDEGLSFALERVSVRLVPVGDGWVVAYRVSLD